MQTLNGKAHVASPAITVSTQEVIDSLVMRSTWERQITRLQEVIDGLAVLQSTATVSQPDGQSSYLLERGSGPDAHPSEIVDLSSRALGLDALTVEQ